VVGQTLAVTSGVWSGNPTSYSFRWESCTTRARAQQPPRTAGCTQIAGATSASRLVSSADVGRSLAVIVTAANGAGSTATSVVGACAVGESSRNVAGSVRISGHDDILTESEVTTGIYGPRCDKPEPIIVLTGARNAQITYTTVSGGSNGTLQRFGAAGPVRSSLHLWRLQRTGGLWRYHQLLHHHRRLDHRCRRRGRMSHRGWVRSRLQGRRLRNLRRRPGRC
jgi:hypothetical protein